MNGTMAILLPSEGLMEFPVTFPVKKGCMKNIPQISARIPKVATTLLF